MSTDTPATTQAAWSGTTDDADQPRVPVRLGLAVSLGALLWLAPYLGTVGVLLPARVAIVAPGDKAAVVALLSTVAMIVATLANILIGALSDLTRSRFGRRTPWLVAGSAGSAGMLVLVGQANSVGALVATWVAFQVCLNAIVAPLLAVIADRIAPRHRGTVSSIYAVGYSVGAYGGQIIGAQFLGSIDTGLYVMAGITLASGPVAALIMRERSSLGMARRRMSARTLVDSFSFPVRGCRDYYLALGSKLAIITAKFAIAGYQLYIFTDYMSLAEGDTKTYISLISTILLITALVFSAVSGPISDRIGSRKLPVIVASLFIAVGVIVPAFTPAPWTMLVYALIAGIGMGIFNSVDQALNVEVLPNPDTAAKDLGVLNLANTGGQVLGPIFAAAIISMAGYAGIFPTACGLAVLGAVLIAAIRGVR